MDLSNWLLFVVFALAATLSPGPAILFAISNSINHGMRSTVFSTLGNQLGLLLLATLAILGLGAVIQTSTTLFFIIKAIGAAYLVYLGIRQWRSHKKFFDAKDKNIDAPAKSDWSAFYQGFLIAATNPKAIVFLTALFPQFIQVDKPIFLQFSILVFTFLSLSAIALISYGLIAHKAKQWLSTERRTKWFNRIFGGLFIALGILLLQFNNKQQA